MLDNLLSSTEALEFVSIYTHKQWDRVPLAQKSHFAKGVVYVSGDQTNPSMLGFQEWVPDHLSMWLDLDMERIVDGNVQLATGI